MPRLSGADCLERVHIHTLSRGHLFPFHRTAHRASLRSAHVQELSNILCLERLALPTLGELFTQSDVCELLGIVGLALTLARTNLNHVLNLLASLGLTLGDERQCVFESLNLSHRLLCHFVPSFCLAAFLGFAFCFPPLTMNILQERGGYVKQNWRFTFPTQIAPPRRIVYCG